MTKSGDAVSFFIMERLSLHFTRPNNTFPNVSQNLLKAYSETDQICPTHRGGW